MPCPVIFTYHLVMDHDATHKVRDWLTRRPPWHVHLMPTSSSWLNQAKQFFALLTGKQIKRSAHRSVAAMHAGIRAFIDQHDSEPKAFRWTQSADDIPSPTERCRTYNIPAEVT